VDAISLPLAEFCAAQRDQFDPDAWYARADTDSALTIVRTAHYLSMTSWYGHEDALCKIAADLIARIEKVDALDLNRHPPGFDLAALSARTRYLIAQQRIGRLVSA
jgi:hypothetical protein